LETELHGAPKLQTVRERYAFCCGYCGVSETDVGGELTVDHFRPVSAGGDDSDANLVYACVRCNQYKGALLLEATDLAYAWRLLHPLQDDLGAHIREDESPGRLEGLTATGRFHIAALRLNRPALITHRQRRYLAVLLEARLEQALAENKALREQIAQCDLYITYLEERLTARREAE
jgi:HNH endonuclease